MWHGFEADEKVLTLDWFFSCGAKNPAFFVFPSFWPVFSLKNPLFPGYNLLCDYVVPKTSERARV